eukprot:6196912-Alexandrium_andersonii.AAC.1
MSWCRGDLFRLHGGPGLWSTGRGPVIARSGPLSGLALQVRLRGRRQVWGRSCEAHQRCLSEVLVPRSLAAVGAVLRVVP